MNLGGLSGKQFLADGDSMTFHGHVQNGVVVFDGPEKPPEGTSAEVAIVLPPPPAGSLAEMLLEFSGIIEGLPPAMAAQHDHYLYGQPKR